MCSQPKSTQMKKILHNNIGFAIILIAIFLIGKYVYRSYFKPTFSFENKLLYFIDEDKSRNLKSFRGKVVIVSCFQTWCSDCARETPIINELATKFDSSKFQVIYITDENNLKLSRFRERLRTDKINFATMPGKLSSIGIRVYPTTFLIDKNGQTILTKLEGYDWLIEEERINKLINE